MELKTLELTGQTGVKKKLLCCSSDHLEAKANTAGHCGLKIHPGISVSLLSPSQNKNSVAALKSFQSEAYSVGQLPKWTAVVEKCSVGKKQNPQFRPELM